MSHPYARRILTAKGTRLNAALALSLLPCSLMLASPPKLNLQSLPEHGLLLIASSDPAFQQALNPDRDKTGDAILPYAVALQNNSARPLLGYTITWTWQNATGKLVTDTLTQYDYQHWNALPAGRTTVASIVSYFNQPNAEVDKAAVQRVADIYGGQANITVSLDAAIFGDGQAVGPDFRNWVSYVKARVDAQRDLRVAISQSAPENLREQLDAFVARSLSLLPPDAPQDPGRIEAMARHEIDYARRYLLEQGFLAAMMEKSVQQGEEKAAIDHYRALVSNEILPTIHR
jgi:hypothetical protein